MAGSRGYRNYRGRTPKWKTALAAVLVLVILVAAGFIVLQEHLVYDEAGIPHLRLPKSPEAETPPEEGEDVELTIQPPEGPAAVLVRDLGETPLTQAGLAAALAAGEADDAWAVTLKDGDGGVYFDSSAAVSGSASVAEDTAAALKTLNGGEGRYTVARIGCFHDPRAANSDVEAMGLQNTGGFIFYDGSNSQWLDPAKPAARAYLRELVREAAELGFDEILLTGVSYPTEGKLDKIAYGEGDRAAHLTAFLKEVRETLEPYGAALSIELPEAVVSSGSDEAAGLSLAEIAPLVDRVYVPAEPAGLEALADRITAAGGADFVPELTAEAGDWTGSRLLLAA